MSAPVCLRCGNPELPLLDGSPICGDCEQAIWDEQQASDAEAAWIAYRDGMAYADQLQAEVDEGIERELEAAAQAAEGER